MKWFRHSSFLQVPAFVLMLAAPAGAQAPAWRSGAWLELGGIVRGQSDLMASPLSYRGTGGHVAVAYERLRPGRRLNVNAGFAAASLTSRITDGGDHTEHIFVATAGVRSQYRVAAAWDGRIRFYAGGQVDVQVPVRKHDYAGGMAEYLADIFVPLQVAGSWEATLGPVALSERLALPLFAVVGRCPYTGLKYAPVFSVAPPGRLVGFDHSVSLSRPVGTRVDMRLEWRTTLIRYPQPRELSMVTHRIGLAVALHGSRAP